MEVSINGVTPPNGWFIMENPINKLRIWGYLHFRKPPYEYMYVNGRWTILPSHNQNIVMYTYTFTSLFLARHSSKGGELSWMATLNISVWGAVQYRIENWWKLYLHQTVEHHPRNMVWYYIYLSWDPLLLGGPEYIHI